MNAKIKHHCIETISSTSGNEIIITIRKARSRKYHRTTINLSRVSEHWLDVLDELTRGLEVHCLHHFNWGFSCLQFRPLKGKRS